MAIITMPQGLGIPPGGLIVGQRRYDLFEQSEVTGDMPARIMGPPRWTMSINSLDQMPKADAAAWQAMMLKLRGRTNHLFAWDIGRPVPRGTMRGAMSLLNSADLGDTSISINGLEAQAGNTLLSGDWLQIGTGLGTSQLINLVEDGTANGSGNLTISFEAPLRLDFDAGTTVTWYQAGAYFRSTNDSTDWTYGVVGLQGGYAFDLLEAFS